MVASKAAWAIRFFIVCGRILARMSTISIAESGDGQAHGWHGDGPGQGGSAHAECRERRQNEPIDPRMASKLPEAGALVVLPDPDRPEAGALESGEASQSG